MLAGWAAYPSTRLYALAVLGRGLLSRPIFAVGAWLEIDLRPDIPLLDLRVLASIFQSCHDTTRRKSCTSTRFVINLCYFLDLRLIEYFNGFMLKKLPTCDINNPTIFPVFSISLYHNCYKMNNHPVFIMLLLHLLSTEKKTPLKSTAQNIVGGIIDSLSS